MRALPLLILAAMCSCGSKDRAGDVLNEAKRLAGQGKFEPALEKFIWFHDHALEVDRSYYGVRLSFALDEWVELGRKYPKALETLKTIRDKKTSRLLGGEADMGLFHDVESINEHLSESQATVELFKKIDAVQPGFASSIYYLAEEALIKAEAFSLAKKYLGDPKARLASAKQNFVNGMQFAKTSQSGDSSRQAFESIFTERVVRIITVLDKTGDRDLAREIQAEALKVLESSVIRGAISN